MPHRADLALFAHVVRRPEAEIDLARAALLIAEPEYPELDITHYIDRLDRLGAEARRRVDSPEPASEALRRVSALVHEELGFHGNTADYYDPRNSFLNEVLDRRVGIPITLAIVVIEVAARAGVAVHGVSFPGHFLLRAAGKRGPVFADPLDGKFLDPVGLRALMARATGEERDPNPRLLEAASKTQILSRMLNNLRGIYSAGGDQQRLDAVLSRLALLGSDDRPPTGRVLN